MNSAPPLASTPPKLKKRPGSSGLRIPEGTSDARRIAAAILEVLGGCRTPSDAAQAVGVSLPRYYALESRAIEGLVKACEPRPKGKQPSSDKELLALRKEVEVLRRDCERKQALVRAAQRTVGLALPEPRPGKGRRRRKPVVRALKAAEVLRSDPPPAGPAGPRQGRGSQGINPGRSQAAAESALSTAWSWRDRDSAGEGQMARGRRTDGPRKAGRMDGSDEAKRRLKVILEVIAQKRTVKSACEELGISEARYHELEWVALQGAVDSLEPKPLGRPPAAPAGDPKLAALEEEVNELRVELRASQIREELAIVMPHLLKPRGDQKKTTAPQELFGRKPSGDRRTST